MIHLFFLILSSNIHNYLLTYSLVHLLIYFTLSSVIIQWLVWEKVLVIMGWILHWIETLETWFLRNAQVNTSSTIQTQKIHDTSNCEIQYRLNTFLLIQMSEMGSNFSVTVCQVYLNWLSCFWNLTSYSGNSVPSAAVLTLKLVYSFFNISFRDST